MRPFTSNLVRSSTRYALPRATSNMAARTLLVRSAAVSPVAMRISTLRTYASDAKTAEEPAAENKETNTELSEDQRTIKDLQSKLDAKNKEAVDLKDRLLRSVADFRNLQEITKKDVKKAKDFALQKFAKDLLESIDNFGHALGAFKEEDLKKSKEINDLYTGVRMTRDVFEGTLRKHGIEKLDPLGETFDPNKHEATFEVVQKDKEPGTVFHVQQLGYTLNDRVIRPAKVGVVKIEDN